MLKSIPAPLTVTIFVQMIAPTCWFFLQNKCSVFLHNTLVWGLQCFSDPYIWGFVWDALRTPSPIIDHFRRACFVLYQSVSLSVSLSSLCLSLF